MKWFLNRYFSNKSVKIVTTPIMISVLLISMTKLIIKYYQIGRILVRFDTHPILSMEKLLINKFLSKLSSQTGVLLKELTITKHKINKKTFQNVSKRLQSAASHFSSQFFYRMRSTFFYFPNLCKPYILTNEKYGNYFYI